MRDHGGNLDGAIARFGGGTDLFRPYATPDAAAYRDNLARSTTWSRIFPYPQTWPRHGSPGGTAEWARLTAAMTRAGDGV